MWTATLVEDLLSFPVGRLGGLFLLLVLDSLCSFLRSLCDMSKGARTVDVMLNTFSFGLILFRRVRSELL